VDEEAEEAKEVISVLRVFVDIVRVIEDGDFDEVVVVVAIVPAEIVKLALQTSSAKLVPLTRTN
jgi:hypothetical protein